MRIGPDCPKSETESEVLTT